VEAVSPKGGTLATNCICPPESVTVWRGGRTFAMGLSSLPVVAARRSLSSLQSVTSVSLIVSFSRWPRFAVASACSSDSDDLSMGFKNTDSFGH
jgi:hypothetical protein